jgi:hypothetical protein
MKKKLLAVIKARLNWCVANEGASGKSPDYELGFRDGLIEMHRMVFEYREEEQKQIEAPQPAPVEPTKIWISIAEGLHEAYVDVASLLYKNGVDLDEQLEAQKLEHLRKALRNYDAGALETLAP